VGLGYIRVGGVCRDFSKNLTIRLQTSSHITPNPVIHMGWTSIIFLYVSGMAWGLMPVLRRNFAMPLEQCAVSLAGPVSNLILGTVGVVLAVVRARSERR
jgi:hypothetical protein